MFYGDSGTALEGGRIRSGRRFRSRKRGKNMIRRGIFSMNRGEDYDFTLHFDEGSCDEEEEYQPISERDEEEAKALDPEYE